MRFQTLVIKLRRHVIVDSQYHPHWTLLLYATGLLGNATYGVLKSEIAILYGMVNKADDPLLYWIALVTSVAAGMASLAYAFF